MRKTIPMLAPFLALILALLMPHPSMFLAAQDSSIPVATPLETRLAQEGQPSPPARLLDMQWLIGQWVGTGIGGAPAMESWLPPTGSTMVGTFIQQTADGDIQFSEHMYLMEEEGSLVLRLKHFNADLTGWEDKEGMVSFRLVAIEHCAAYFHGLTLRCEYRDDGTRILAVAVRMKSGGQLSFRFRKASAARMHTACNYAVITNEIDGCVADLYSRAEKRRKLYFKTALEGEYLTEETARIMAQSKSAFEAYRDAECKAIYENYRDGTIRNYVMYNCLTDLANHRTHIIWKHWIYGLSGDLETLPEPAFID